MSGVCCMEADGTKGGAHIKNGCVPEEDRREHQAALGFDPMTLRWMLYSITTRLFSRAQSQTMKLILQAEQMRWHWGESDRNHELGGRTGVWYVCYEETDRNERTFEW